MLELIEANWIVAAAGLGALLLAIWLIFGRSGKPALRSFKPDVLDEGVAPAQRNQSLIDAAPSALVPPIVEREAVIEAERIEAPVAMDSTPPPRPPAPTPAPEPIPVEPPQTESPHAVVSTLSPTAPPMQTPQLATLAGSGDDLSMIKGLGPKLRVILEGLGVTSFGQIAAWSDEDLARIDPQLGAFAGRPARDSWVEQAKFLVTGDVAGFEAKFGKV